MTTRKERVAELRKYHEEFFEMVGVPDAYFDSKAVTIIENRPFIGFFESQLAKGTEIYFEINDFKQGIIDSNRTLYRLNPHKNFKTLKNFYKYVAETPAGIAQYYVCSDCDLVEKINKEEYFRKQDTIGISLESLEKEDCNYSELTARDYACIHLKVPESNKKWLNELIKKYG